MELHLVESMGHSKAPSSALETDFRMAAQRVLCSAHSKDLEMHSVHPKEYQKVRLMVLY
jgi:hypothetical protein